MQYLYSIKIKNTVLVIIAETENEACNKALEVFPNENISDIKVHGKDIVQIYVGGSDCYLCSSGISGCNCTSTIDRCTANSTSIIF